MPEGKLRSGVYRSFIMCDDPREVVDCGAIKKQSNISNNRRVDHNMKAKGRSEMAPRKSTEEEEDLSRVSKGIRKLNVAGDSSLSKGFRYEAVRPGDIAKDLLRGALDLEESLAMLSGIQEDDIKQKQRIRKDRRGDSRFQRSMSDRFGERIEKRMAIHENLATRNCYEELRKVIRESFLRQNLLQQTTTSTGTKTRVVRSDFASSSGAASSSSSSQSGSTKSSASSEIPRRAPSLIARLMGLDVSPQEPAKSTVDILKLSSERQEQLKQKKSKKEAIPEIVRRNSTKETGLKSLPEEIPSENPSTIVLIRPMSIVQPEMEEKTLGNQRPVLPRKPRMQGEVHPRMIDKRKDHQQATGASKRSSNQFKLPLSRTKKEREPKEMVRKVEENEGKEIKLMSPSNAKAVTRERKPKETNKNISAKKEDIGEGYRPHDRVIKPLSNKKSSNSSDMSKNKSRRSRLNSSSSNSDEQKSSSREKKSSEASRPNAKKKLCQHDNDLVLENNSQDVRGSLNQLSAEETTCSEVNNIQGHGDNGEVTSCAATVQHSHEPEISLNAFLSNSPEFLNYAEDLFDFDTNSKRSQESAFRNRDGIGISDQRLALAFAKEVATRRSLLPITGPNCPQRSSVNFDELVMEVCDEFESLRRYRDTFLGQNSFDKENIESLLEKDLKSKKTEMTIGVWDSGWRSEFRIDETHQAVVDLEKLIMSGLIREILS